MYLGQRLRPGLEELRQLTCQSVAGLTRASITGIIYGAHSDHTTRKDGSLNAQHPAPEPDDRDHIEEKDRHFDFFAGAHGRRNIHALPPETLD
jgi:hypothetical protein